MKEKDEIAEFFKERLSHFEADSKGLDWSQMKQTMSSGAASSSVGSKLSMISGSVSTKVLIAIVTATLIGGIMIATSYFSAKETRSTTEQQKEIATPQESNTNKKEESHSNEKRSSTSTSESESEKLPQQDSKSSVETAKNESSADIPNKEIKQQQLDNKPSKEELNNNQLTEEQLEQILQENEAQIAAKPNKSEVTNTPKQPENLVPNALESDEATDGPKANQTAEVSIIIPNVFTPNQDGINDIFIIEDDEITSLEVQIIDKTGQLIHEWNTLYGFWDGNLPNGEVAPEGIYFYQLSGTKNGKAFIKKDLINLKR